jgi:hypothetical protein
MIVHGKARGGRCCPAYLWSAQRDSRLVLGLSWLVSAMRVAIRLPCIAPAGSHHCELLQMGRRGTVDSCAGRNRTRALAAHETNTGGKS